jgi:alpha-beta hydrolase superfamily lysophospholipase
MPSAALRRRSYLGLELELARDRLAVVEVDPAGPAARARVQVGDHLLAIDGVALTDLARARRVVAGLSVEAPCRLELSRGACEATPQPLPLEVLERGRIELGEVHWDGHRLRAIWSLPEGAPPHPVIWLLPGSTWLSDEHPTTPWHPTRRLCEQLTGAGFATLRVERSGLGDSEGPPCTELDLEAELSGFRAAFAAIDTHPAIDARRMFVFGRSLGGMLLPLVLQGRAVAGAAVWGSTARRWHDAILRASLRQYALAGDDRATLARRRARLAALQSLIYEHGLSPAQAYERRPDLGGVLPAVYAGSHVYGRVASYFQQLQRCDLARAFAAVDAPLLALHGGCDWLSELGDLQAIARLCGRFGQWRQLPGIDHHMHLRTSLQEAFTVPWGGSFSRAPGAALIAFFEDQTLARVLGSGKTPP